MSNLDEIATFVHVVDCGGISAAARRMKLPKSTVSRRLVRLEEALSVRLLQRTTRKLQLTDAGRDLFDRSADAISRLEDASRRVQQHQDKFEGCVRVTAPVDYGQSRLAPVIAEYSRRFPHVELDIELTSRIIDLIEEGYDLAIRAGRLPDSTLVARRLKDDTIGLFVSPTYERLHGTPKRPKELSHHKLIHFTVIRTGGTVTLTQGEKEVSVEVEYPIKANDVTFVRHCVLEGPGLAFLPRSLVEAELEAGTIIEALPSWTLSLDRHNTVELHLVYPTARQLPARVRAMRDLILEMLR
ncbi:MAG: LysR family transcriptional regulator [Myxococcota bacterium]|nr:LysR family transcriptional regulator [Myxococcota bacterium]